jgi:hypothetical protein
MMTTIQGDYDGGQLRNPCVVMIMIRGADDFCVMIGKLF